MKYQNKQKLKQTLLIGAITLTSFTSTFANDTATDNENTANTNGVFCDYKNNTFNSSASVKKDSIVEWNCSENKREIKANGIPDHPTGTFPNPGNRNTMTIQDIAASFTTHPKKTSTKTEMGGPRGTIGFILNGIKIDAGTGGTCNDSGSECRMGGKRVGQWRIEAIGQDSFNFGEDENNAHVQPGGVYHYHGIPEGFVKKRGGDNTKMTLIGWAADGFPIYARYGYEKADDAKSSIKKISASYKLVTKPAESRPSTDIYPLGTFGKDWEYIEGSGDLDECNGRTGVTPEFPQGIYHYFATDNYPYFQRCVKGAVTVKKRKGPPGDRPRRGEGERGERGGERRPPPPE